MSKEKVVIVPKKPCCKCNETKPLHEFCRGKNFCKDCTYKESYLERNRDKVNSKRTAETRRLKTLLRGKTVRTRKSTESSEEIVVDPEEDSEDTSTGDTTEDSKETPDKDTLDDSDEEIIEVQLKGCIHCDKIKPVDEFMKGRNSCKDCHKSKCKERYEAKGHIQRERQKIEKHALSILRNKLAEEKKQSEEQLPDNMKQCTGCNNVKSLDEFQKTGFDKFKRQLYRPNCKACSSKICQTYFSKSKEYFDIKYHNEPEKKLLMQCRDRVRSIFKSGRENTELIGCDINFLYDWFSFQLDMSPDMNMENYGKYWHIDHVIPCAKWDFTNEEHKKACFHWTNLAPLQASKNIAKSDKISPIHILQQNLRIKLFEKITGKKYPELIIKQRDKPIAGSS